MQADQKMQAQGEKKTVSPYFFSHWTFYLALWHVDKIFNHLLYYMFLLILCVGSFRAWNNNGYTTQNRVSLTIICPVTDGFDSTLFD